MEKIIKNTQIKPMQTLGSNSKDDPRIDSPEISVVYPSVPKGAPTQLVEREEKNTVQVPNMQTPVEESFSEQNHECKVTWQDAISQNGTPFLIIGLVLFGLGYMIGKK